MIAGRLRHRITIQTPTETSDGMGGITTTWATFKTVWAMVEPLRGREYLMALQQETELSHRVRIRHLDGLTTKKRVKWGSRYFDIEAVLNWQERNIFLDLMCRETTPVAGA